MKSLGLNQKDLFEIGIIEHLSCSGEILNSIIQDERLPNSAKIATAEHEAILKAVAKMIEENNKMLLQQLNSID